MRLLLGCLLFAMACDDGADPPVQTVPSDGGVGDMAPTPDAGDAGDVVDHDAGLMADAQVDAGPAPDGDAGLMADAQIDAQIDAGPAEPSVCRITSMTFTSGDEILDRTTYVYDDPGPRSAHTINQDQAGDGTIERITRVEYPDDGQTLVREDADGDGEFESTRGSRTVTSDDGLTVDEVFTINMYRVAYHSEFLSADRTRPEGLFPRLRETDDGDDGTVNLRVQSAFEGGRLVRQARDSSPARWERDDDDDLGPDGAPEVLTAYTYTANTVTEASDVGRASCDNEGRCEAIPLDGEIDRVVERTYGADGQPELLWAGRPDLQRNDDDADGTWDLITAYAYDARGYIRQARFDYDADGAWDAEQTYVYECLDQ